MRDKICIFKAETDVNAIDIDLTDAQAIIVRSDDDRLCVTMPQASNLHAACDGTTLYISQQKRPIFSARQTITVSVPGHIVPSVKVGGKKADVHIEDGIYGEIRLDCESAKLYVSDADAESLNVCGDSVDANLEDTVFRRSLYVNARNADFLAQHTFAGVTVVRTKKGSIGIVRMKTRDCTLETEDGNITATLTGRKQDFNLNIVSGSSPSDRSEERKGTHNFSAFARRGSVTVDFAEEECAAELAEEQLSRQSAEDETADEHSEKEI